MIESKSFAGIFAQCPDGHALQGPVAFCPYCRKVPVAPPVAVAPVADKPVEGAPVADPAASAAAGSTGSVPEAGTPSPAAPVSTRTDSTPSIPPAQPAGTVEPVQTAQADMEEAKAAPAPVDKPKPLEKAKGEKKKSQPKAVTPVVTTPEPDANSAAGPANAPTTPGAPQGAQESTAPDTASTTGTAGPQNTSTSTGQSAGTEEGNPPPTTPGGDGLKYVVIFIILAIAVGAMFVKLFSGPSARELGAKRDKELAEVVSLAKGCKLDEARAASRILTADQGSPEQQREADKTISEAAVSCERDRRRTAAWNETRTNAERAAANKNFDHARTIVRTFNARWKEDDASHALLDTLSFQQGTALLENADACLKTGRFDCVTHDLNKAIALDRPEFKVRITEMQEELAKAKQAAVATLGIAPSAPPAATTPQKTLAFPTPRPTPAPSPAPSSPTPTPAFYPPAAPAPAAAPSVDPNIARLQSEAERRMRDGNYKGASDSMQLCLTLDPSNGRCQQAKQRAEQLNRNMLSCVAAGKEWTNDRCE